MNKKELLEMLEEYNDDTQVVISLQWKDVTPHAQDISGAAFEIKAVGDGWKPSNVAALKLGELVMG